MAKENKQNEQEIRLESPCSNRMKNSFLIKNADPSFDRAFQSMKKRNLEKANIDNTQQVTKTSGKRPAARDGHAIELVNDKLFVFGGDRHHMPFNDFHLLDIRSEI